jgi:hypothetical protein
VPTLESSQPKKKGVRFDMAADAKPSTGEDPGKTTNMGVDYVISYRFATSGMFFASALGN